MKITLKEKEIELKYTFRSLMIYEQITGATFQPKGITEIMFYFYSTILASAKDLELTFDEFIEWNDENPNLINDFSKWVNDIVTKNNFITSNNESKEEDPKKN